MNDHAYDAFSKYEYLQLKIVALAINQQLSIRILKSEIQRLNKYSMIFNVSYETLKIVKKRILTSKQLGKTVDLQLSRTDRSDTLE